MSDAPKAQTALDYCVEIAAHERMADYLTCWDEVAAQYQSPKVLASSASAELAALRARVAELESLLDAEKGSRSRLEDRVAALERHRDGIPSNPVVVRKPCSTITEWIIGELKKRKGGAK